VTALADFVRAMLVRDLAAFEREIAAYPDDASLWAAPPGTNAAGTLALHVVGNLRHFVGALLGGTAYVRDRDAEFSRRGVPRAELLAELAEARRDVEACLGRLPALALDAELPLPIGGRRVHVDDFLVHLATHLAYHLGQVDYHRRLTTSSSGSIGALSITERACARPAE
jgi:hypothetical protein